MEHGKNVNACPTQNTDAAVSLVNPTTDPASNTASQSSSTDDKQETTDNTSLCTVKSNTVAPSTVHSPKLQRDDGNGNTVGMRINNSTDDSNSNSNSQSSNKTSQAASTTVASTTESKYTESKNVDTSVVSEFAGDASSIRYGKNNSNILNRYFFFSTEFKNF